MGHIRLGTLPNTRPWRRVVAHLAEGDGVGVVAAAATRAAAAGLARAKTDPGFADVVELLARLAAAARSPGWPGDLPALGIDLPADPSALEVVLAFQGACLARGQARDRPPTDLADIALAAAVAALSRELTRAAGSSLFGGAATALDALKRVGTKARFAGFFHRFFAGFAERFLRYHLDRELSLHLGETGRFHSQDDRAAFEADLAVHCDEAALVVRDYAGEWFSKSLFATGLSRRDAERFGRHCLEKLEAELLARGVAA